MDVSQSLKWPSVDNTSLITIECDEHMNRIPKFVVMLHALAPLPFSLPIRVGGKYGSLRESQLFRRLRIEHNGNNTMPGGGGLQPFVNGPPVIRLWTTGQI